MEIDDYYNLNEELIKHTSEGNNKYLVLTKGYDVIDDKTLAVPSKNTIAKMEGIFNSRSSVEKGIAVETSGADDQMLVYAWFQATTYHRSYGDKVTVRPDQASKSIYLGTF